MIRHPQIVGNGTYRWWKGVGDEVGECPSPSNIPPSLFQLLTGWQPGAAYIDYHDERSAYGALASARMKYRQGQTR